MKQSLAGLAVLMALTTAPPPVALAQIPPAPAAKPSPAVQAEIDLILAADMDGYLAMARKNFASAPTVVHAVALGVDEIAQNDPDAADEVIAGLAPRRKTAAGDLLEMWIALARNDKDAALKRAALARTRLAKPLGDVAPALLHEANGDLKEAADAYAVVIERLDTSPLPPAPVGREATERLIEAPRAAQVIYRAAQVNHRLGRADEALRNYLLAEQFAPDSPDIAANMARLARKEQPFELALDRRSGLGRWLLFASFQYSRDTAERAAGQPPGAADGATQLAELDSALLGQLGFRLDRSADDWVVATASELTGRNALPGAEKLARSVRDDSPYAPDAKLVLARLAIARDRDTEAAELLASAMKLGAGRGSVALEAGRNLAVVGRYDEARRALTSAIDEAAPGRDKAEAYLARAGANYQAGHIAESAADARAAIKADGSDGVRLLAAGLIATAPDGWYEAVRIGRELLLQRPRNVDTMNTLGYALIQRDQGLDEGYKILRRAVDISPDFFPVVDSLGWAYYQYGDYEQALKFVDKANELSDKANAEVLDHLGDIYWRLNRAKEARDAWRKALDSRPEALRRAEIEQKLTQGLAKPAPVKRTTPPVDGGGRPVAPSKT